MIAVCQSDHRIIVYDDDDRCPACELQDRLHDLQRDLSAAEERLEAVLARRVGCGMGRLADEGRAVT